MASNRCRVFGRQGSVLCHAAGLVELRIGRDMSSEVYLSPVCTSCGQNAVDPRNLVCGGTRNVAVRSTLVGIVEVNSIDRQDAQLGTNLLLKAAKQRRKCP
jgi:hypothetical protein